ncbi:2OG-Fe(II) oxygenase [Chryseobacterium sp. MEBOG06]|uniref:2OG-Fe(II) oxygenase n=1 Tax=Chryseobacterium sp. MEBOG06 TaxID=2879938 RepID=UPI001F3B4551|nr:2OG-Fe(II) oxygenase [Chryseobacterium sp. MEBOG06]UKB84722.1 2OG-Fe(II) oxygenase [Chryseobacterium sp. MEBOG06]
MEKLAKIEKTIEVVKVDNKEITIINNFLDSDEINAFYEYVSDLSFVKKEKDDEYDEYPIFSVDFIPEEFINDTFIGIKIKEYLQSINMFDQFLLYRSSINMSHYGDVEFPHYDCPIDRKDITVLLYVNNKWDYKWGGETLFYESHDSKAAVLPKPGRLVIFPGNIEHLGGVPTRICKASRFSLALKFAYIK